jgi:hypothetical protein
MSQEDILDIVRRGYESFNTSSPQRTPPGHRLSPQPEDPLIELPGFTPLALDQFRPGGRQQLAGLLFDDLLLDMNPGRSSIGCHSKSCHADPAATWISPASQ